MGKSETGFILCLIGGIIQIIAGIIVTSSLAYAAIIPTIKNNVAVSPSFGVYFIPLIGIWVLAMGIMTIVAGVKMRSEDSNIVKKWGILAIVFAIIGLTGNILTIIGGIVGIVDSNKTNDINNTPQP